MVNTYKGSQLCANEKKQFDLCRATPQGKHVSPEVCEEVTANFLECYHQTLSNSRLKCKGEYESVIKCLKSGSEADWKFKEVGKCAFLLDKYAKC